MKNILFLFATPLFISIAQGQTNPPNVKIGTQTWMVKNLDIDHYRNGDPIPEVKDPAEWSKLTTGGWCYYENDPANGKIYGKLYNWYAVNDPRGLVPKGWHVASDAEWAVLITYLGGDSVAGGKMKETGTAHWKSPNTRATNISGFTGLPGGIRVGDTGPFYNVAYSGVWWSSSEGSTTNAWDRNLFYLNGKLDRCYFNSCIVGNGDDKLCGFSVRCLRD